MTPTVETQHNDNNRTGANLNEIVLDTSNVNSNQFGRIFQRDVDGQIYAQPLYLPNLDMGRQGIHNVVYVATMHNTVYAFDADDPNASAPLWSVSLGASISLPDANIGPAGYRDIEREVGILSTPVVGAQHNAIYVVAATKSGSDYQHTLHALNLVSGAEMFGGPVTIRGSVPGTGDGSQNGVVPFTSNRQLQRAGLLLQADKIYIAFASYGDAGPYHGWVFAYEASTLKQAAMYNATPNGGLGGIWQSGQGLAADDGGIYFITGNGSFNQNGSELGDSFVKLGFDLTLRDWFAPFNNAELDAADADLGSSGVLLIPGTDLLVGGGKEGKLYVLSRNNLGHFHAGNDSQIVQSFFINPGHEIHGGPVFWNGPLGSSIYVWPADDFLKAYRFTAGAFQTTPASVSTTTAPGNVPGGSAGLPGGMLSLSANGGTPGTGIVWASHPYDKDANQQVVSGIVYAYDASDLTRELWNSKQNSARDDIGTFAKFCPPTVANAKVYVASFSGHLAVYGLLASVHKPVLNAGGLVNAAGFGPAIAMNTWISIFGSDLSGVTRTWRDQDFHDSNLPTELEGVSVRIGGQAAYIYFISPEQLNVLAPAGLPAGPAQVQVTVNGSASNMTTVEISELAPACFLFTSDAPRYVVATHADGTPCAKETLFPGLSTPAAPGEVVVLYATGLGQTTPAFPSGKLVETPLDVAGSVKVHFGPLDGDVSFAGLTLAGLYQINVMVPDGAPEGDVPVIVEVNGATSPDEVFLTVQTAASNPVTIGVATNRERLV